MPRLSLAAHQNNQHSERLRKKRLKAKGGGRTVNALVANRLSIPVLTVGYSTTTTFRREHWASPEGDITDLQPIFYHAFYNASFLITNAAPFPIKSVLEFPAGVFHPVFWSGNAQQSLTGGGVFIGGVVLSSFTGLPIVIPAGMRWWERTVAVLSASTQVPNIVLPAAPSVIGVTDGKIAGDYGTSGVIPIDTASVNSFGATAWRGTVLKANARSFVSFGDSLDLGQGDITGTGANGSSGFVARAIDDKFSHLKCCRGSQQISHHASIMNGIGFPAFLSNIAITDVVLEAGLNDLSLGSRTAAQIMADRETVASKFPSAKIWHTTLTNRVDTNNAYGSVEGQTPKVDGNMNDLVTVNTLIRAKPNVIDFSDAASSARNSRVNSGPFPFSADGTHYNTPKNAAIAALAASAVK